MTLTSDEIQKILPHRYPFLLVDRILECEPGKYAKGIKCVTANEMQYLGHFPGYAVMPGVLIVEALAQTGAVAVLSEEENKGKLALFRGIDKCKFKKQVTPGDTLELSVEMTKRMGPMGYAKAEAKIDGKIACQCEISFVIGEA